MSERFVLKACAGSQGWYEILQEVTFPGRWQLSKIERSVEDGRVVIRCAEPRQGQSERHLLCIGVGQA